METIYRNFFQNDDIHFFCKKLVSFPERKHATFKLQIFWFFICWDRYRYRTGWKPRLVAILTNSPPLSWKLHETVFMYFKCFQGRFGTFFEGLNVIGVQILSLLFLFYIFFMNSTTVAIFHSVTCEVAITIYQLKNRNLKMLLKLFYFKWIFPIFSENTLNCMTN